jgi:hypothetical protein
MPKITQYPNTAASLSTGDLIDVSKRISVSPLVYESQKAEATAVGLPVKIVAEINAENFTDFQQANWGKILCPELNGKHYKFVGDPVIARNDAPLLADGSGFIKINFYSLYIGYGPAGFIQWDADHFSLAGQSYYTTAIPFDQDRAVLGPYYYKGGLTSETSENNVSPGDEGYPAAIIFYIGYQPGDFVSAPVMNPDGSVPLPEGVVIHPDFKAWIIFSVEIITPPNN